ncbi:hypothetical protein [Streptomyces sp. SJL17-1]|uniref:hypothetical protein n=1 Tax=Streptomyces sp. SJL17-1 TaxID=2967223 RepID=UPI0029672004|nr:hypothetical protein [Streptomyces sp. SJL17-1]
MSVDAIMHTEFPEGYTVFFGADGKVIMTPQSLEHSTTIKSLQYDTIVSLGRHAKTISDVYLDFPADENSAPDLAILREDSQRVGKRYGFEDVLLIAEVVTAPANSPSTWPMAAPSPSTLTSCPSPNRRPARADEHAAGGWGRVGVLSGRWNT